MTKAEELYAMATTRPARQLYDTILFYAKQKAVQGIMEMVLGPVNSVPVDVVARFQADGFALKTYNNANQGPTYLLSWDLNKDNEETVQYIGDRWL